MEICTPNSKRPVRGKWFFLGAFIFACFLFWWLPSLLFRAVVHQADTVESGTIAISALALVLFIAGYLFPTFGRPVRQFSEPVLDACGNFAYTITIYLTLPALILAVQFWRSHSGTSYAGSAPIPLSHQAVLYIHLFFGFMFLGASNPKQKGWRRILIATILVTLPRLIISLHWGRFFLAQAIVPALLIAFARGWIHFSVKRVVQVIALALAILFVPALTRGDSMMNREEIIDWFAAGSTLRLYQKNIDLNLNGYCNPFLVGMTAKVIPYGQLDICVLESFAGKKRMPATISRILTFNDPLTFLGTQSGTGGNYLLELYLLGGLAAVYAGSALFGFICRQFVSWIGIRSLFSGIWAECLTRALFAPRGEFTYVFERIPSLVLTTLFVVLIVWVGRLMRKEVSGQACASYGKLSTAIMKDLNREILTRNNHEQTFERRN
jgi:hypothetical protein